jgi:hypothetical protein
LDNCLLIGVVTVVQKPAILGFAFGDKYILFRDHSLFMTGGGLAKQGGGSPKNIGSGGAT